MSETTYKIVRGFFNSDHDRQIIETGLTLAEAQKHCRDPETSSRTATSPEAVKLTETVGQWFDGYEEE